MTILLSCFDLPLHFQLLLLIQKSECSANFSSLYDLIRTHGLRFILEPVPHNHVPIPATSNQQAILWVKGHTVQRARAEQGCYLMTFSRGPDLTAGKQQNQLFK